MSIEQQFEEFWQAYPKRVGRISAFRQYQCAVYYQDATHAAVMAGVEAYRRHLIAKNTDPQYIAAPARWLADGRWDDEYEINLPKQRDNPFSVRVGETASQAKARIERSGLKLVAG